MSLIKDQIITDHYALYRDDCISVLQQLPSSSIHFSVYSPPFQGLYQYSSDPRDLSNAIDPAEFFTHYAFVVAELARLTLPGRMTAVHCSDIPTGNTGLDHLIDFPGKVIALHEQHGWKHTARYHIWKEPLTVRNRTMSKSLSHKSITLDSTRHSIANADYVLIFRREGANTVPVTHPRGLLSYAGSTPIPQELLQYRNYKGKQIENKYSHWIWRQYADAFWLDVRVDRVLPFRPARDAEDERHVHPLQLDVIERALTLYTNPGEIMLTPFMGVGSEVYGALLNGRKAIGIELKPSYYHQAVKNVALAEFGRDDLETLPLFPEAALIGEESML